MLKSIAAVVVLLCACAFASAQATRTWVSGVGDDANPCSRTAPCKTFAGAISKTAVGGEIDVLDPGGFGAVTITKSISIEACCIAGVLVSGTNGIVIQAPVGSFVVLRGLTFDGLGTGLAGIKFMTGTDLRVEQCEINNFTAKGIDFVPNQATPSNMQVTDCIIKNCQGASSGGIHVAPTGGGAANVTIENTRLESNNYGLRAEDHSFVTVNKSSASTNINNGFLAASTSTSVAININDSVSTNNGVQPSSALGSTGVVTSGANALIRISNVIIAGNLHGISCAGTGGSGHVASWQNNYNADDGSPDQTITKQ
jgi:hypothetical protein